MGLDFHGAALVAFAAQQRMPMRSVLTLGRQESIITAGWCRHLQQAYGADLSGLEFQREPYAEPFFRRLGAERVDALDYSAYQGAAIVRDLNKPPVAEASEGYDLVFDGGTLEHVFHFPNAIANCMSLVKMGGHFMASLPANQWFGHGFYQFGPELFFRVFSAGNGFEIVRMFLAENSNEPGRLYRVLDPAETGVRLLLASRRPMLVLVWAKKIAEVKPFSQWPQQSDYSTRWQANAETDPTAFARKPGMLAAAKRAAGELLPISVRWRLAWRKHLREARRGLIPIEKFQ